MMMVSYKIIENFVSENVHLNQLPHVLMVWMINDILYIFHKHLKSFFRAAGILINNAIE